jgi:signal transduction histidine kinase
MIKNNIVLDYSIKISILIAILSTRLYSVLLFHTVAELFSIIIGITIFIFAWNSREYIKDDLFLFIGIGFLFVSSLDIFHTLTYKNVGIINNNDSNIPTQFWIAARYLESLILLAAFYHKNFRIHPLFFFLTFLVISGLSILSIVYWKIFPACYIEGSGLTLFKKISEYIICLILAISIILLIFHRDFFSKKVFIYLLFSIIFTIFSELAFTFYIGVFDVSNQIGHLLKIISFYFMFSAIIETGLKNPYELIFRNLTDSNKKYSELISRLKEEQDIFRLENIEKTKELLNIKSELASSKRLSNMGTLASKVAHELRNPLSVMKAAAYNINKKNRNNSLNKHISNIEKKIDECSYVISSLLEYTRLKKPEFQKISIKQVINDVIESFKLTHNEKDYKIKKYLAPIESLYIKADPIQLKQVLTNVIENSYQARDKNIIAITFRANIVFRKLLSITIKDSGGGIEPENINKIFDPFFSTKAKGTGLGLTICNEIISMHGGNLLINSKKNYGTTVYINLPL